MAPGRNHLTGEIACNDVVMFACSAPPHYSGTTLSETGLVRGVAPGRSLTVAFIDGRADTVRVNVK